MKIRFQEMHDALVRMDAGQSIVYSPITGRELTNMRADVAYFFQGHVEPQDNRIGAEGCEHISLEWDWRIEDTYTRNEDDPHLWDLTLTKVETPDQWKYSGKQLKRVVERREAVAKIAELDELDIKEAKEAQDRLSK